MRVFNIQFFLAYTHLFELLIVFSHVLSAKNTPQRLTLSKTHAESVYRGLNVCRRSRCERQEKKELTGL